MATKFRILLALSSLLLCAIAIYDCWLWQPERQLFAHHAHFLTTAGDKNWTRFAGMIAPGYRDRWGHDKMSAVRESREVLRQFFTLTIQSEVLAHELHGEEGSVTARLKINGNGTALAEMARQEINCLSAPFVFTWTRQSWKPWDWQLTAVENPQLRLLSARNGERPIIAALR